MAFSGLIAKLILSLLLFGIGYLPLAFGYSLQNSENARFFPLKNGFYLIIQALQDDVIHLELTNAQPEDGYKIPWTEMIDRHQYPGPSILKIEDQQFETGTIKIDVESNDGCFIAEDKLRKFTMGRFCIGDWQKGWSSLSIDSQLRHNAYGLGSYFQSPESADGDWIGKAWDPLFEGYGNRMRGFYGGANSYLLIPILYILGAGNDNYGIFVDEIKKQFWDLRSQPWTVGKQSGAFRFFLFAGSNLKELRSHYLQLTGRPAIPPKRAFGLWVSEFGYESWEEVKDNIRDLRNNGFPFEGFGMDLQWFGGSFGDPDNSRMGTLRWDSRLFPDYQKTIEFLKDEEEVELMLIEEPYVASHLEEHDALTTRGFLAKDCASCSPTFIDYDPWWGRGGIVDYTNPDASQFWHQFRRQDLYRLGISSHWLDLGEPEQYNPWAWYYGFPERGAHGHGDIHNIYNLRWVQGIYDSYVNLENSERPFLLSRSGTAGIQRYGTSLWSGDIGTNWGNLRAQHQVQMQMALSGIDYYGSDVGGFQRANHNVPGGVHQLYSVWYANSALFDIPLRPHAWNLDKNLSTSPSSKGHLPSNLTNTVLRYHLSPYYYSLAHKAHKQGEAIVAPAVYHFQNDLDLRLSGTMKTIGPFLLAKALADPHLIGSDVYLPKGIWYDFHRHFQIQSRGELVRNLPLYLRDSLTIPLFVKEGAILPVMTVDSTTKNLGGRKSSTPQNQPLEIKIYPSSEGSNFDYFEDDGYSFEYLKGRYNQINISQIKTGDRIQAKISKNLTTYKFLDRSILFKFFSEDFFPSLIEVDGIKIKRCDDQSLLDPCWDKKEPKFFQVKIPEHTFEDDLVINIETKKLDRPKHSASFACNNIPNQSNMDIFILGSHPSLGAWQIDQAIKLEPTLTSSWSGFISDLEMKMPIEWKCLAIDRDLKSGIIWQSGPNNQLKEQLGNSAYLGIQSASF